MSEIVKSRQELYREGKSNQREDKGNSYYYEVLRRFEKACAKERETNPSTDPDEALARIKRILELGAASSENKTVTEAYNEILRRSGLNPEEWIRYPYAQQPKGTLGEFTAHDMERVASRYPNALEFFAIQGEPWGVSNSITGGKSKIGDSDNYGILRNWWIVYLRKRPSLVEGPKD